MSFERGVDRIRSVKVQGATNVAVFGLKLFVSEAQKIKSGLHGQLFFYFIYPFKCNPGGVSFVGEMAFWNLALHGYAPCPFKRDPRFCGCHISAIMKEPFN